ncbi:MAG TPA: cbb3-type cytochrome oxidase assembly protein CcoS [Candidatus Udaeobacter sp.]|nr:cbb3-type cytochrome oxidase assembly protein CcoS [Candidatus Udaeobacter sp.]
MTALLYLVPAALFLGLLGLGAFLWALKSGQFEDLDGAAERILIDEDEPDSAAADQAKVRPTR